ncbi:MAG: hypothetical protein U0787_14600 [Polyangia bacterium]
MQTEKRAEDANRSERQARQKLAEVEGLLLRAKTEMAEQLQKASLPQNLDVRQRELEAARREILVARRNWKKKARAFATEGESRRSPAHLEQQKAAAKARRRSGSSGSSDGGEARSRA